MKNYFNTFRTPAEIVQATGLSLRRVQQYASELISAGLARKFGSSIVYHVDAVKYIRERPNMRGLGGKNEATKEKILAILVAQGTKHPEVWKGYSASTHKNGWHFREFGESQDIYLGKSFTEIKGESQASSF